MHDLLGPLRWSPRQSNSQWPHLVLGLPKRRLLRDALGRLRRVPSLASYARDVQTNLEDAEGYVEKEERAAAAAGAGSAGRGGAGGGSGRGGRGVAVFDLGADPYADGGGGGDERRALEGQEQLAPGGGEAAAAAAAAAAAKAPVRRIAATAMGSGGAAPQADGVPRSPLQQLP